MCAFVYLFHNKKYALCGCKKEKKLHVSKFFILSIVDG